MILRTCPACHARFKMRLKGRCPWCGVILLLDPREFDNRTTPAWRWSGGKWERVGEPVRATP